MLDFWSVTLCQIVELGDCDEAFRKSLGVLQVIQASNPLSDDIGAVQNQIQES